MNLTDERQPATMDSGTELASLRKCMSRTRQLLVCCDTDYHFVFANDAYAQRFGVAPSEIIGKCIPEILGTKGFDAIKKYVDAVCQGAPQHFEVLIPYDQLGERWLECEYLPDFDAAGRVTGFTGFITDISDRKAAEKAREVSDARLENILNHVEALVFAKSTDGKYVLTNRNFEESLGCPREKILGRTDADLFPPNLVAEYANNDATVLATGKRFMVEESALFKGVHREFIVSKFPLRDQKGQIEGVCGVATDITELKNLQVALQEREAELRIAIEAGKMANWEWDLTSNRVRWSPLHFELLGYGPGGFAPSYDDWASRVHPEDLPRLKELHRDCLRTGKDFEAVYRVTLPDGSLRWLDSRARISFNQKGLPMRMIGVMFDITPAKNLEAALRSRENAFREQAALLDLAHDAILVRDLDGKILYWNRSAEETYGWSPQEARGQISHELLQTTFPGDRASIEVNLAATGFWEGELRHVRRNGRIIIVDSRWALRRDETGQAIAILEINRDITSRKRTEESLREKQERLVAALTAARAGTFRWNIQTNDLDWDESLDRLFGLPPGQTARSLGVFIELVHPEDRAGVTERCEQCARDGRDFDMEFRVKWPDGTFRWLHDRGKTIRDDEGNPIYMSGACVDVTERKEAEVRLKAAETRERIILEYLPLGVWFIDKESRITYGNKTGHQIWGGARYVAVDEFKQYRGWWHENGQPIEAQDWAAARAFRERRPFLNQMVDILTFDGLKKTIMNSAAPVVLPDGSFEGVVVFNLDLTEQALMQDQLKRSHEELELRVRERTARLEETVGDLEAFSYSISHDMRSPLRSMQGFADSLLQEHSRDLAPEAKDMLLRIQRAAYRLDLLIMDVLAYSRISKEQIQLTTVNLDQLVLELISSYPSFQEPQARVQIEGTLGLAIAHPAFLSQVFTNLLGNAVKFVENGVRPTISIRSRNEGDTVRISVKDNGIGIAPEHAHRIFALFGRIHPAKMYPGTGIGLAIVKKAVERMGGKIGFDSTPGFGSEFWFTLNAS